MPNKFQKIELLSVNDFEVMQTPSRITIPVFDSYVSKALVLMEKDGYLNSFMNGCPAFYAMINFEKAPAPHWLDPPIIDDKTRCERKIWLEGDWAGTGSDPTVKTESSFDTLKEFADALSKDDELRKFAGGYVKVRVDADGNLRPYQQELIDKVRLSSTTVPIDLAMKQQCGRMNRQPTQKVNTMKEQIKESATTTVDMVKNVAIGKAGLQVIKTTLFNILPTKSSWWARITGQHKKYSENPLVVAGAAFLVNQVAQRYIDNQTVKSVAQSMQDVAVLEVVEQYANIETNVKTMLENAAGTTQDVISSSGD